jgi:nucleotide-binding universal stress UspA family protein
MRRSSIAVVVASTSPVGVSADRGKLVLAPEGDVDSCSMPPRLLMAFDDSDSANAAIRTAAALFSEARGRVLTVFDRTMDYETARPYSFGVDDATLRRGLEALARQAEDAALEIARHGSKIAAEAGLRLAATIAAVGISDWPAFVAAADEIGADAIVCGSRGRGAMARSLLGSTSTGSHASRDPAGARSTADPDFPGWAGAGRL